MMYREFLERLVVAIVFLGVVMVHSAFVQADEPNSSAATAQEEKNHSVISGKPDDQNFDLSIEP